RESSRGRSSHEDIVTSSMDRFRIGIHGVERLRCQDPEPMREGGEPVAHLLKNGRNTFAADLVSADVEAHLRMSGCRDQYRMDLGVFLRRLVNSPPILKLCSEGRSA